MKKTIYLLLIVVFASFTISNELITISGKITNTENRKLTIKGESFEKEIKLKADGTFSENITIEYNGIYTLEINKNSSLIYLSKGAKLTLIADDKAFNTSIKYTGKGSIENQYLTKKSNITSQIPDEELYKLDENDFLKKIKEIKSAITTLYNKTKFSDINYKEKEAKHIHYWEQKNLFTYKKYHYFFARLNGFEVSENFPKIDEEINLDNDSDFLFSNEYKELVLTKFYENIKGGDGTITAKDAIPEIKALKSQSIKNRLIQNSVSDINIENINYEKIYNEYLAITTDTKLKEILTANYNNTIILKNGNPSPKFDYENYKGGKIALESLKGKYVYIDVWATWCGPCRQEIPSLQKVEAQYQGKNIEFVSISIDSMKDHEKWSKLVNEKQLGGIQLLADKEWDSKFIKDYGIQGIPRFILIDPNGNIINSQAPRPSDTKLIDLFNSLQL
ncbi:TlpA family protein disulfide reductase [Flavobacterium sp. LB3P122]|uniref:TlpA family protein disulfide reductase n=1 Tax=Flavobacterium algoriphilum TaxID=3398738 RepID=UPI003A8C7A6F